MERQFHSLALIMFSNGMIEALAYPIVEIHG